ncbi:amastin-like surface protein-like protein [Leptomonas pyrrhocoris]|uniref:Amastin-like surface protein-like protein n=1 Tax=Leptomonas pyrrhocoris TaxID=157538 RepID=A0A0M9FZB7_LEPPY|nr:amastin-like surface protein-like protein [Leptomonas pyrrhocoris]KPA79185.1 amastin-like surface protein-like protein [Leptomonas pyrrhocoris]|eukprot:XP_015657624.1 amastin-like surface protein-like protein [Leptomonas pyrrhocoris]
MRLLTRFVGAIVFAVIETCVFVLVVVATPLEQFEERSVVGTGCYTLFGHKQRCRQLHVTRTGTAAFHCAERRDYVIVSAVFAVLSIAVTLAAMVLAILMVLRIPCAVLLPLVLSCIASATTVVSWACLAVVYNRQMCVRRSPFKLAVQYGTGFGMMVTAACLQLVDLTLLCVLGFA